MPPFFSQPAATERQSLSDTLSTSELNYWAPADDVEDRDFLYPMMQLVI